MSDANSTQIHALGEATAHLDTATGAPASGTAPFAEDRHKCRAGGRRSVWHATSLGTVSRCASETTGLMTAPGDKGKPIECLLL